MHVSGPLLEWLAAHHREHLSRLRALVSARSGRAVGRRVLRAGAARHSRDRPPGPDSAHERLDRGGAWRSPARRVAGRARVGAGAGRRRCHAPASSTPRSMTRTSSPPGFDRERLWGAYLDRGRGRASERLPIRRELRYLIPFQRARADRRVAQGVGRGARPGALAVLGDDGEKFGVWPGTRELCWEQGWLERLRRGARGRRPRSNWCRPAKRSTLARRSALAYLPSASYHEMQEWSLPPAAQRRYQSRGRRRSSPSSASRRAICCAAGTGADFQMRYAESNRMHKRMLRARTACTRCCRERSRRVARSAHAPVALAVQLPVLARRVRRALSSAPARSGLSRADRRRALPVHGDAASRARRFRSRRHSTTRCSRLASGRRG